MIFILFGATDYEGTTFLEVYSSRELLIKAKEAYELSEDASDFLSKKHY